MTVREYGFELELCATLEADRPGVVARQLGAAVDQPGSRVMDIVHVAPGPEFERRVRLTPETIPRRVVEADVGIGEWRPVTDAVPGPPERARAAADRGAELGVLERERRDGRTVVRRVAPYPDWFGELTGVENKPDLGSPGALAKQVRLDVALGVFDRVVVATASHVTGAHLNRLPSPVGVWEFDPAAGDLTVVRAPERLEVEAGGTEIRSEHPLRTEVALVDPDAKRRARRRIAERAYGKGWRPERYPHCTNCQVSAAGVPWCTYFGRVIDPGLDCGPECPGHDPGDSAAVDPAGLRASRTGWDPDPPSLAREQAPLDRFEGE